jgi:Ca2+-binding EF-hand superfamily protein
MNASKGRVQTRRNLEKMAKHQADHSRMAKPAAKAMNRNYLSARVSVVPEFVKLEPRDDIAVQEQLLGLLKEHSVKLIDLFRQWDHDGNGGISFDEFREGFAALGSLAPARELKAVFKSMDTDNDNFVEFEEFKVALSLKGAQEATRLRGLEHSDLSGSRPSAQLLGSFLAHHKKRLVQMFHEWDTDRNGALDKSELRKAIVALGWPASAASCNADLDEVYSRLDHDGDGTITFVELQRGLNALGSNPGRPSGASKISPTADKQRKLRWENGVLVDKGSNRPTVSTVAALEKGTKPPGASAFGAGMAGMAKDVTPAVQEAETEPRRPPPLPPPAPPAVPALAQVCAAWLEEERLVEARRAFLMQKLSAEGYGVQFSLRRSQSPPQKTPSSAPVERSASFGRIRYPTARAVAGEPLVHRSTSFGRAPPRFRGDSRHRPAVL